MRGSISVGCLVVLSATLILIATGHAMLVQHQAWLSIRTEHMQAYYLALSGFAFAETLGPNIPQVSPSAVVDDDSVYAHRYQGVSVDVEGGTVWLLDTAQAIRYSVAILDESQTPSNSMTARAIVKRKIQARNE